MKNLLSVLLLFMLILPTAFALSQEKVFEGPVYPGNITTTTNKLNFTIFLSSNELSLLAKFADRQFSVDNNSCSHDDLLNVCYNGVELGYYDTSKPDPAKGTSYTQVDKARLSVYVLTANLNMTREIDKSSLWAGENANVKATFTNLGDRKAENTFFSDNYSSEIEVYSSTCPFNSFKTYWEGSIAIGETKSCYYVLRALGNTTYNSKAKLSYESGNGIKTIENQMALNVKDYALQTSKQYKQSLEIGEEAILNVTLRAASEIAVFYYTLSFPKGIRLLKSNFTEVDFEKRTVKFYGKLLNNESTNFYVRIRAEYAGEYTINEEASLRIQDIVFDQKLSRNLPLTVIYQPLVLSLNREKFLPGKNKIALFITNPSNITFYEISINISTNLTTTKNASFSELKPATSEEVISEFEAREGSYPFEAALYYKSQYGQVFITGKSFTLIVSSGKNTTNTTESIRQATVQQPDVPLPKKEEVQKSQDSETKNIKLEKIEQPSKALPLKWMIIAPVAIILIIILLVFLFHKREEESNW